MYLNLFIYSSSLYFFILISKIPLLFIFLYYYVIYNIILFISKSVKYFYSIYLLLKYYLKLNLLFIYLSFSKHYFISFIYLISNLYYNINYNA